MVEGVAARERTRGWLEAQGRLLSPTSILLRFVMVAACVAALELGRNEGLAFAVAILWHGQCYQLLVLHRVRQLLLDPKARLSPGWIDVPWELRGATHHMLRVTTSAGLAAAVLYIDPRVSVMALVACHFLTEGTGVMLGRVIDKLIQVEAERRVAVLRGEQPPEGFDRGDYRRMGEE